jgi:hypothetical protein
LVRVEVEFDSTLLPRAEMNSAPTRTILHHVVRPFQGRTGEAKSLKTLTASYYECAEL